MKKVFVLICGMMMSVSVSAATCIGGTMITGKDTTRSFCLSDKTMNWWAAYQWCVGNGRILANLDNLCNYDREGWFLGVEGCPNFTYQHQLPVAWSSMVYSSGTALVPSWSQIVSRSRSDRIQAVCE